MSNKGEKSPSGGDKDTNPLLATTKYDYESTTSPTRRVSTGEIHHVSWNEPSIDHEGHTTSPGRQRANSETHPENKHPEMRRRSYSVNVDGSVSYLTPLQMGRHELYELVPFTAVFGLQKMERNLSTAFCSFAADLDTMCTMEEKKFTTEEQELHRSKASDMLMEEMEMDRDVVTSPLIFAVLVAAMATFSVGFNTGVMNAPEKVVFPGHSTAEWSWAVAAFAIGGPFGAILGGNLADTKGRRGALLINTWLFLLGGLIQTFALDMLSIMISRLIIGFASGYASVLVPIYLGEMAPPTLRGTLGTLTQFALVIGILFSDILAFAFANETLWRVLFSFTSILAISQLCLAPFLLESPRWMLHKDPTSLKARVIIRKLRGMRYDAEVETEVDHYLFADRCQQKDRSHTAGSLTSLLQNRTARNLLVSALVLQMSQQLCGINAVFYYSNSFFDGVISDPLVGTTIVGAVNVVATYAALLLMDSCGRRTLILWSSGGMFLCCIVIVLSLKGLFENMVALMAVNLYVIFFEIGLGPIPWLIVAEMFDAQYVATAMSACSQLNWACNFIVGLVFPYLNEYLHEYSFLPFAFVLLFTFFYTLFFLPETQGTTPDELQAQMVRRHSNEEYHNINIEECYHSTPIDMEWKMAMEEMRRDEEKAMSEGRYNYGFHPIDTTGSASNLIDSSGHATRNGKVSQWKAQLTGIEQTH